MDPEAKWRVQRQLYRVLLQIHRHADGRCTQVVQARQFAHQLRMPLEELYRAVYDLTVRGYLDYLGAGPRVCITEKGLEYIEHGARRRQSIRD